MVSEEPDGALALRRLHRLGRTTERRVISLHTGAAPDAEELERGLAPLADLIERGVAVRVVCVREFARPAHLRATVATLTRCGVAVRFADALPRRLVVADGATAVVALRGSRLAAGAAFVADRPVVERLEALADRAFRRSVPLDQVPADGSAIGPSPLEERVIHLMSTGVTDDVAARRLHVTDRQYRRYVAAVMCRLGATSRFQAGMLATRRGWLPDPWPDDGPGADVSG